MPSRESLEIRKTLEKDKLRDDVPIEVLRREWEEYALSIPPVVGITLDETEIAGVPCLIVSNGKCRERKLIIHIHGGGLVEGSPGTHREFASMLVDEISIAVLLIDYRLAPEHPFPAALDDVCSVYGELLQQGYSHNNLYMGGDSSGAGLALASVVKLKDEGHDLPRRLFLISGVFDQTLSGESMKTRSHIDPFTSEEVLAHCARLYSGGEKPDHPLISPLFADLSLLPPLLIMAGDHEILLSDSVRLAENIREAGGSADLKIWDSMWHCWPMFAGLPEAGEALREIGLFLLS